MEYAQPVYSFFFRSNLCLYTALIMGWKLYILGTCVIVNVVLYTADYYIKCNYSRIHEVVSRKDSRVK